MNIYLDMDGVITNFSKGCEQIFDWPHHKNIQPDQDIRKFLGLTNKEFWEMIDSHGEEWWANLEPENWTEELVNIVKFYDSNFLILTSPSLSHQAASGKVLWLQKFFKSKRFKNYIITPAENKQLLANSKSVLIDDNDKNCEQFREKLGYTILFPRSWNQNYLLENSKIEYVKSQLKIISQYI